MQQIQVYPIQFATTEEFKCFNIKSSPAQPPRQDLILNKHLHSLKPLVIFINKQLGYYYLGFSTNTSHLQIRIPSKKIFAMIQLISWKQSEYFS